MIQRSLSDIVRIGVLGCILFAMSGGLASADDTATPKGDGNAIPKGENPNLPGTIPEIDAGSAMAALTMLSGGLLLITDRFRKGRSSH